MSKISFRPRGGQEGIEVTIKELDKFSTSIGSEYLDAFIPLPNLTVDEQKIKLKGNNACRCEIHETQYWETDKGNHGWCCNNCGKVIQWG